MGLGQGHGWEGAVLRLLGGRDFVCTVTGAEDVGPRYRRVHLTDGGMLTTAGVHPTMWIRLWFERAGRPHQRAYTLVAPDPVAGTFSLEFALHDGPASDWARSAAPGDTIGATVHGTSFVPPRPVASRVVAIGDPASLPAINSLLTAVGTAPATIWLETDSPVPITPITPITSAGAPAARTDRDGIALRATPSRHELRTVPRRDGGAHLVDEVRSALPALLRDEPEPYVWIACDTATTRTLSSYVRKELALPKHRVHALGYWRAA
ncbi:siderophore-interacting protein [Streptomyces sp. NPDC059786]|uniref:siderophore-interacting protein n=1 Tax=Streptomyces sp. NPDC059786 TaxID=3346946 RepID=UPI00364C3B09